MSSRRQFGVKPRPSKPRPSSSATSFTSSRCSCVSSAGLVERLERRARELELAAGLQRELSAPRGQRDDVAAFDHRLPAEARHALSRAPMPSGPHRAAAAASARRSRTSRARCRCATPRGGLLPAAKYSTSWRRFVIGVRRPTGGADIRLLPRAPALAVERRCRMSFLTRARVWFMTLAESPPPISPGRAQASNGSPDARESPESRRRLPPVADSACQQARAAIAAVSARRTRGPSPTAVTMAVNAAKVKLARQSRPPARS